MSYSRVLSSIGEPEDGHNTGNQGLWVENAKSGQSQATGPDWSLHPPKARKTASMRPHIASNRRVVEKRADRNARTAGVPPPELTSTSRAQRKARKQKQKHHAPLPRVALLATPGQAAVERAGEALQAVLRFSDELRVEASPREGTKFSAALRMVAAELDTAKLQRDDEATAAQSSTMLSPQSQDSSPPQNPMKEDAETALEESAMRVWLDDDGNVLEMNSKDVAFAELTAAPFARGFQSVYLMRREEEARKRKTAKTGSLSQASSRDRPVLLAPIGPPPTRTLASQRSAESPARGIPAGNADEDEEVGPGPQGITGNRLLDDVTRPVSAQWDVNGKQFVKRSTARPGRDAVQAEKQPSPIFPPHFARQKLSKLDTAPPPESRSVVDGWWHDVRLGSSNAQVSPSPTASDGVTPESAAGPGLTRNLEAAWKRVRTRRKMQRRHARLDRQAKGHMDDEVSDSDAPSSGDEMQRMYSEAVEVGEVGNGPTGSEARRQARWREVEWALAYDEEALLFRSTAAFAAAKHEEVETLSGRSQGPSRLRLGVGIDLALRLIAAINHCNASTRSALGPIPETLAAVISMIAREVYVREGDKTDRAFHAHKSPKSRHTASLQSNEQPGLASWLARTPHASVARHALRELRTLREKVEWMTDRAAHAATSAIKNNFVLQSAMQRWQTSLLHAVFSRWHSMSAHKQRLRSKIGRAMTVRSLRFLVRSCLHGWERAAVQSRFDRILSRLTKSVKARARVDEALEDALARNETEHSARLDLEKKVGQLQKRVETAEAALILARRRGYTDFAKAAIRQLSTGTLNSFRRVAVDVQAARMVSPGHLGHLRDAATAFRAALTAQHVSVDVHPRMEPKGPLHARGIRQSELDHALHLPADDEIVSEKAPILQTACARIASSEAGASMVVPLSKAVRVVPTAVEETTMRQLLASQEDGVQRTRVIYTSDFDEPPEKITATSSPTRAESLHPGSAPTSKTPDLSAAERQTLALAPIDQVFLCWANWHLSQTVVNDKPFPRRITNTGSALQDGVCLAALLLRLRQVGAIPLPPFDSGKGKKARRSASRPSSKPSRKPRSRGGPPSTVGAIPQATRYRVDFMQSDSADDSSEGEDLGGHGNGQQSSAALERDIRRESRLDARLQRLVAEIDPFKRCVLVSDEIRRFDPFCAPFVTPEVIMAGRADVLAAVLGRLFVRCGLHRRADVATLTRRVARAQKACNDLQPAVDAFTSRQSPLHEENPANLVALVERIKSTQEVVAAAGKDARATRGRAVAAHRLWSRLTAKADHFIWQLVTAASSADKRSIAPPVPVHPTALTHGGIRAEVEPFIQLPSEVIQAGIRWATVYIATTKGSSLSDASILGDQAAAAMSEEGALNVRSALKDHAEDVRAVYGHYKTLTEGSGIGPAGFLQVVKDSKLTARGESLTAGMVDAARRAALVIMWQAAHSSHTLVDAVDEASSAGRQSNEGDDSESESPDIMDVLDEPDDEDSAKSESQTLQHGEASLLWNVSVPGGVRGRRIRAKGLSPSAFSLALCILATLRRRPRRGSTSRSSGKRSVDSVMIAKGVKALLQDRLVLFAKRKASADDFRSQLLRRDVRHVYKRFASNLRGIFTHYAAVDRSDRTARARSTTMNKSEFHALLRDCRLEGPAGQAAISTEMAAKVFESIQVDEDGEMEGMLVGGGETEMIFGEFLEALAAIAVFKYPDPFAPLSSRLNQLIQVDVLPLAKSSRSRRGRKP